MCKCEIRNCCALEMLKSIDSNSADMVLTDPPYQISRHTGFKSIGTKGVERFRISMDFGEWDKLKEEDHINLIKESVEQSYRILKKSGTLVMFYDLWKIQSLSAFLQDSGFKMLRLLEWVKTNPVPLNSKGFYLSNGREIAIACVKEGKPTFNSEYNNGIFNLPIHRDGGKRVHPTQKPLVLMKKLIEIHTNKGDTIIDPFAGSGTTLLAALSTQRNSIGSELDPKYFAIANERITNAK